MSNNYDMPSSQIAKNRLLAMKQNSQADILNNHTSTQNNNSNTAQYIQNPIHLDNSLLWDDDHNKLSSKGD